jgi:large subunit ribosomal protein L19
MELKGITISPVAETRAKLNVRTGDTVKVWQKIKEKDKYRLQAFEGLVLSVKHGKEAGATFTVRKVVDGIGVERIFPIFSPMIDKVEILKSAKIRRSKLYHIREKANKEIKRQMRNLRSAKEVEVENTEEKVENK